MKANILVENKVVIDKQKLGLFNLFDYGSEGIYGYLRNKKIGVFGTGSTCDLFLHMISNVISIDFFIDNDQEKQGICHQEKKIIAPQELYKYKKEELFIFIASSFSEITFQLLNMGFEEGVHFLNSDLLIRNINNHLEKNTNPFVEDADSPDRAFFFPEQGVISVSKERWKRAQEYEADFWLKQCSLISNDRQEEHYFGFDHYRSIIGRKFLNAIELGCGPFTNLRIIGVLCEIERCTLLDPLIKKYLAHVNCRYDLKRLTVQDIKNDNTDKFILINKLIAQPIEEYESKETFDLIVCINVLEHCYNLDKIFKSILSMCKENSIFIFHDKIYNSNKTQQPSLDFFDIGHPLQIDYHILKNWLKTHFATMYFREYGEESFYFIGEFQSAEKE